jgi:exodeoxyribonuclease III
MKIATYNVNSVNARLPVLLDWLKETQPDVACLQELKAVDEKFPMEDIYAAGYKAVWKGQKSWNGVAILAKKQHTIKVIRKELPGESSDEQSRYIEAEVNGILICCLYLPNGNPVPGEKFDYKLRWMERLHKRANELKHYHLPVVITGDFNVIPQEIDAYKPENWVNDALFKPESRAAFEKIKGDYWTDAIRHLHPDEVIYTYWDFFKGAFPRNAGIRIDHFLVSPQLKDKLAGAGVDKNVRAWEKTSDHAPVWIEVKD